MVWEDGARGEDEDDKGDPKLVEVRMEGGREGGRGEEKKRQAGFGRYCRAHPPLPPSLPPSLPPYLPPFLLGVVQVHDNDA